MPFVRPAVEHSSVEIVTYRPDFSGDFDRLNRAWLEKYFTVEPLDEEYLGDPEGHILRPGGEIFFAVEAGRVSTPTSSWSWHLAFRRGRQTPPQVTKYKKHHWTNTTATGGLCTD